MSDRDRLEGGDWTERCECLRAEALGSTRRPLGGMALLLNQGMAAWMFAWERRVAPARPSPTGPRPAALAEPPAGLTGQVAEVLAGMILHCCPGGVR